MDLMRATRKDQALTEWNSSGSYGQRPILFTTRTSANRSWLVPSLVASLAASVGLSAGLLLRGNPQLPAPVVAVAAPAAPVVTAPALAPAPAAPVVARQGSSPKAARCLSLGWDFYAAGAYDRASDMAMEALVAVGQENGSAIQRAQARGLLDASQNKLRPATPHVVQVQVPDVQPQPQAVPALIMRPEPAAQVAPAQQSLVEAYPVPAVEANPAPLPAHSYPLAGPRRSPLRVRVSAPQVVPAAATPRIPFQRVAGPLIPGMTALVNYPTGRGPEVCPNYFVDDDCECHQFERSFASRQAGLGYSPQASRPMNFGASGPGRSLSRVEQMRRGESLLGRGM